MESDGMLAVLEKDEEERKLEEASQQNKERLKLHIAKLIKAVDHAVEYDDKYYQRWINDRRMARGETNYEVSSNLIGAIMEVLLSFLYAKDPDLNCRPSDSVAGTSLKQYRIVAETIEIVVSRLLRVAGLKRQAKRWVRSAETVGVGWLKSVMQMRSEKDPIMQDQINDLTDQYDKIKSKNIRIDLNDGQRELLLSEVEQNIRASKDKLEQVVAEGMVIDYMKPEDVIVSPECGEVENYLNSPWICFRSYKTKDEALAITGWETEEELAYLNQSNRYYKRPAKKSEGTGDVYVKFDTEEGSKENQTIEAMFLFYEIWHKRDATVYTLLDGCLTQWARQPYTPITGQRFYPCFQLAFHYVDGERYPQSDVTILTPLQNEYNATRSDYKRHRERAIPGIIFDKGGMDEDDVDKIQSTTQQEYIGVDVNGADLNKMFAPKIYNKIDPALYDTSVITREMEKLSGAQDALQSSVQIEKTATEARIQESGFGARTDSRRDQLEDVLTELSEYTTQLALQQFDQADAEKYAGPDAIWVQLSAQEAMTFFDIEVKAGSTGKPKATSDRESWPTLMPLIQDTIMKVGEARMQGQEWAAMPWIQLLEETLNRLDDHADIEKFLPEPPPEAVTPPGPEQPEPKPESEVELDKAKTLEATASAVDKVPSLMFSPETRELLGMEEKQEASTQELMAALQGGNAPIQ